LRCFPTQLAGLRRDIQTGSQKALGMKTILLAVCGLSPQVITETLYALHQNGRRVDAIHAITTRQGKERIFATLLAGQTGHFYQYLRDYGMGENAIEFGPHTIHVITDPFGIETADITSQRDNETLLADCLRLTHRFTSDSDTSVYFSIAGGRKTMSACLTCAAQLYGRPRDRLYHVLVSPEFERSPDFFYPPRKSRRIALLDPQGRTHYMHTRDAEVTLVPLPFVSIRDRLAPHMLDKPLDPGTLMLSLVQDELPRLTVNVKERKLIYKRIEIDLQPTWMALYVFFVMVKKGFACEKPCQPDCSDCFQERQDIDQDQISDVYCRIAGSRPVAEMSNSGINSLNNENFNSYKTRIRAELEKHLGPNAIKELEIASVGKRPNTRYGILMPRDRIEIIF